MKLWMEMYIFIHYIFLLDIWCKSWIVYIFLNKIIYYLIIYNFWMNLTMARFLWFIDIYEISRVLIL